MKRLLLLAVLAWGIGLSGAQAQEAEWGTDFLEAKKEAAEQNKPILLDFTGSDWCGWCIKFDKETLSTPEFAAFAKEHLILLKVDFPQRSSQPVPLAQQNRSLAKEFKVTGFPTLILMTAQEGTLIRFDGYEEGGPKPFIVKLRKAAGLPEMP